MVNELMAKWGVISHDFWDHFFLMVTSDHLIFGINSNVMVNGGDETKTSEREIQAWRHKFQFLCALLSQARKSILVILI